MAVYTLYALFPCGWLAPFTWGAKHILDGGFLTSLLVEQNAKWWGK